MRTGNKILRNIADRLNAISSISNNGNGHSNEERDDDYYLNLNRDPPRFYIYRQARAELGYDYEYTTQDELDYALKRRLRVTPEQRYQDEKQEPWFHELYVEGGRECNNLYEPCCIPGHCRFADEYGVITDEEIIQDHNELVEYYRQNNKIVEPPSEIEMQRRQRDKKVFGYRSNPWRWWLFRYPSEINSVKKLK